MVGGYPLLQGDWTLCLHRNFLRKKFVGKGGDANVSVDELIQFVIMICAVAGLFYQIGKRK